jgi:type I restriction enzyme, R subunit
VTFSTEQLEWLGMIKDQVSSSVAIDMEDFDYTPFNQHGGAGKAAQLFGELLPELLDELNEALAE